MNKKAPFPIHPLYTAIAIAYMNQPSIANDALPVVPVGAETFKYMLYKNEDRLTIPNTKIGRTSEGNVVEFGATDVEASTIDYGLDDYIPQKDIDNAPPNFDPLAEATTGIMELVELDRELRVRNLLFDANQYGADNKEDIVGTKFSAAATDPIAIIETAKETMIAHPNQVTLGQDVYSALRRNPNVLKAVHGTLGDKGIASKAQLEDLFEMTFHVGRAFHNTANKGQPMTLQKVWRNNMLLQHIDANANTGRGMTFGMTAQYGTAVAGAQFDPKRGLKGSHWVRAGKSVVELLTAPELGYLLQNAA